MKTMSTSTRRLARVAAALLLASLPARAHAAFMFTLSQVGANVVVTGSGTLNTTALNPDGGGNTSFAFISPGAGGLYGGPTNPTQLAFYSGLTGPVSFGSGGMRTASSGSGDLVGFYRPSTDLIVPFGYASGTTLSNTDTYAGQSFATLGINSGTYTYTWGTGANADSLTINAFVPEPSTWALVGIGVAGAGVVTLRRRRGVRA